MIKSILALHHKVLPPTLKVTEPDPNLNIHNSSLYLNTESRPWFADRGYPRRAGVSAFGFGGSNFHAVLEEYRKDKKDISWDGSVEMLPLCAASALDLIQSLSSAKSQLTESPSFQDVTLLCAKAKSDFSSTEPYRLVVVIERSSWESDNGQTVLNQLDETLKALKENHEHPEVDNKTVFFGGPKKSGKIAFVFPGQGAQYVGMGKDLVCTFPDAFSVVEQANKIFKKDKPLSEIIYPLPVTDKSEKKNQETELTQTDNAQPAIGSISLAMLKVLDYFGLAPEATCGHSFGELVALNAAGWIDDKTLLTFAVNRGKLMAAAGKSGDKDPGTMTAVKAPLEAIDELLKNNATGVILANRNNPEQGVLSGPTEAIEKAEQLCKEHKFKTIRLTVAAAFHSHLMKDAQKPFMDLVINSDMAPTKTPVFSNTTGVPYPTDAVKAKTLLGEQILCPVDFVNDIKNLHRSGIETFVEVGPKTVLTGLIKAILKEEAFNMIPLDGSGGRKSGILDLAVALAHLAALGYPVSLDKWEQGGGAPGAPDKPKMEIKINGANYRSEKSTYGDSKASRKTTDTRSAEPEVLIPKTTFLSTGDAAAQTISKINLNQQPATPEKLPADISLEREDNRVMGQPPRSSKIERSVSVPSNFAAIALQTVQEGLKSMQALQQQTAQTHQKFLESQMESNRTLQKMIDSTQHLVASAMGISSEIPAVGLDVPVLPLSHSASAIVPSPKAAPVRTRASIPSEETSPVQEPILSQIKTPDKSQSNREVQTILLETVSDLTGYPVEMLGLEMDIEADLGIDSIKRVEILSTMEEKIPGLPQVEPEMMGSLKTLKQIIGFLSSQGSDNPAPSLTSPIDPAGTPGNADVSAILLQTVSDLTGYPIEMLGLEMDIEADLGIDSIKRVEILSTMEEKIPGLPQVEPEMMGSLKTLNQIISFLSTPDTGAVENTENSLENHEKKGAQETEIPSMTLNRQVVSIVSKKT